MLGESAGTWRAGLTMRLNVRAFGLTTGLIWGLGLMMVTWWIMLFDGETGEATIIGRVYRGYSISIVGSFVGLVWGLVDGLIGGVVFAWLYNAIHERLGRTAAP